MRSSQSSATGECASTQVLSLCCRWCAIRKNVDLVAPRRWRRAVAFLHGQSQRTAAILLDVAVEEGRTGRSVRRRRNRTRGRRRAARRRVAHAPSYRAAILAQRSLFVQARVWVSDLRLGRLIWPTTLQRAARADSALAAAPQGCATGVLRPQHQASRLVRPGRLCPRPALGTLGRSCGVGLCEPRQRRPGGRRRRRSRAPGRGDAGRRRLRRADRRVSATHLRHHRRLGRLRGSECCRRCRARVVAAAAARRAPAAARRRRHGRRRSTSRHHRRRPTSRLCRRRPTSRRRRPTSRHRRRRRRRAAATGGGASTTHDAAAAWSTAPPPRAAGGGVGDDSAAAGRPRRPAQRRRLCRGGGGGAGGEAGRVRAARGGAAAR